MSVLRSLRVFGLVALCLLAAHPAPARTPLQPLDIQARTGARHFMVEMAADDASRERGLMYRRNLAGDRGMLFDFKVPQPVSFWMKNTYIPLDLLFIADDGRIVSIHANARPFDETPIPSEGDVRAVLEIRGGRAQELGIQPGDKVRERIFH